MTSPLPSRSVGSTVVPYGRWHAVGWLRSSATCAAASAPFDDVSRDPDRMKSLVLEHHRVLHGVVLERAVLPLRFGAVFSGDDGVATTLAMHCDALWEALDRVDERANRASRSFVIRMFSTLT